MLHALRRRLTYANTVSSLCLFIVLGGGAFAATKLVGPKGQIRACVSRNGGLHLRHGRHCARGRRLLVWNQRGRRGRTGRRGPRGLQGIQGIQGQTGRQGPGATSYEQSFPNDGHYHDVIALNGVKIRVYCGGNVSLAIDATNSTATLSVGGTRTEDSTVSVADAGGATANSTVALQYIAKSSDVGKWTLFDLKATHGAPCVVSGLVIPPS